jgi:pimeloyl-ACP methyl ester carboxylesterase
MPALRAALAAIVLAPLIAAQEHVSFRTRDGGLIQADVYGAGSRGVVLAHGGQFNKESWTKQAQTLANAGFRVVAIDFRGYGQSRGPGQKNIYSAPLHLDILAAVDYLRAARAASISLIGASMGGSAAADAVAQSPPGAIDRLVLLAAAPDHPEKLQCRTLTIVAREDSNGAGPRLPEIRAQYEKTTGPKELIVLEGSAHAQFLFQTNQGERVMREILRFLAAP